MSSPLPYSPLDTLRRHVASAPRLLRGLSWSRRIRFLSLALNGRLPTAAEQDLLDGLGAAMRAEGHDVLDQPVADADLVLVFHPLDGTPSLRDRIPELGPVTLGDQVTEICKLPTLHPNLVVGLSVPEDLGALPHVEIEDLARMTMTRLGAMKVLFLRVPAGASVAESFTLCTMEGGHPEVRRSHPRCFEELRDRLVTQACARSAGGFERVPRAVAAADWEAATTPDAVVRAGRRLGALGHLDAPIALERWASPRRVEEARFVLGWSRQSAGALGAFAPELVPLRAELQSESYPGSFVLTATGREEVDKRALRREEDLVVVSMRGEKVYSLGVGQARAKSPSIECEELVGGMLASPALRVSRCPGGFREDPSGTLLLPSIRAVAHLHRGVRAVRPVGPEGLLPVLHVLPNLEQFPYAVGCGKDLMFAISRDAMARASRAWEPDRRALAAAFDVPNHGTNFLLFASPRPGTGVIPEDPFELWLDLLDPDALGALELTPEVPQI